MFNQKLFLSVMALIVIGTMNCTSQPVEIRPGEQVMPYPSYMTLKNDTLVVNAINADGRYSFGRLVAINTSALDKALEGDGPKNPLPWASVVTSNTLIPTAAGMMSLDGALLFASSGNNRLYKMALTDKGFACNEPQASIDECGEASSFSLSDLDPLAVQIISSDASEEIVAVSYASSSRIDLISFGPGAPMKSKKQLDATNFIRPKIKDKISSDEIVITKKIQVEGSLAYFLLERQIRAGSARQAHNGAYIAAIPVADLVNNAKVPDASITLWNLKSAYSMTGVHDFFIDQAEEVAYILGRSPEALFKINLKTSVLVDMAPACMSASSLAVSKTKNRIVMPCFSDNRIASFTMTPLAPDITSSIHGQGPIYAVIDESKNYIYVSFFGDGRLAIFDDQLKYLGHIFEPVSSNGNGG